MHAQVERDEQVRRAAPDRAGNAVPVPYPGVPRLQRLQRQAGNCAVTAMLAARPPQSRPAPVSVPVVGPAGPAASAPVPGAPAFAGAAGMLPLQRGLVDSVVQGAAGLRDRAVHAMAGRARELPGYSLLCVALGRDVLTGAAMPRTAVNLVGGIAQLVPGGQQAFENLQRANVLQRASDWVTGELPKLGLTWDTIRALFTRLWNSVGPTDLLNPFGLWDRLVALLAEPFARIRAFAVTAGPKLLEILFEGVMTLAGGDGAQIMALIRRAGAAFDAIVRDPIGFGRNLVAAVRGGLARFVGNIANHLRTGLFGWLTGALGGAVRLPARFDLAGIVSLALELLGLTWDFARGILVRRIGEPAVRRLETAAGWIRDIATRGLSGIADRIAGAASGLVDTVIGGIRDWVAQSVVGAAVTRLLSLFNPAGAVIQAIMAVYNTIKFFAERASQIAALANSVFDSIAAIASGAIGNAIMAVETALARSIPVVLGFLARLLGLGDISGRVRGIIERVRGVVIGAIERVLQSVGRVLGGRGGRAAAGPGGDDLASATAAASGLLHAQGATPDSVRARLEALRQTHRLTSARLLPADSGRFSIRLQRATATTEAVPLAGGPSAVDKAAVGRAVAAAAVEFGRARSQHQAAEQADPDRNQCFASGGGTTRSFGINLAAARRTSSEAWRLAEGERAYTSTMAEAQKNAYLAGVATDEEIARMPRDPDLLRAIRERVSGRTYIPQGHYSDRRRIENRSVFATRTREEQQWDAGAWASRHAEKLVYQATRSNAIGVSLDQCEDCVGWFRQRAMDDKRFLVVHDPTRVRVYLPDGAVRTPAEVLGGP